MQAPAHTTVLEAAAVSRDLKEKLEALPEVESASVVVVPLGMHEGAGGAAGPALLLPASVAKAPGSADVAEGALLAESAALSSLASALMATAPTARRPLQLPSLASAGLPPRPSNAAAARGAAARAAISRRSTAPPALHPRLSGSASLLASPAGSAISSGIAEQMAWIRSLRDRPDRGLRGATFRRRDTSALLAVLDRRPTLLDAGLTLEVVVPQDEVAMQHSEG